MALEEFSKKHILILTGNSTHFLRLFSCSSTFRCNIIQKYTVMAEGRSNSVVFPFVKLENQNIAATDLGKKDTMFSVIEGQ